MWQFFEDTSQQIFSILAPELTPTDKFFHAIEKGERDNVVSFINSNNINIVSLLSFLFALYLLHKHQRM